MVNVTERGFIIELLNVRLDLVVMEIERNDMRVVVAVLTITFSNIQILYIQMLKGV